MQALLSVWLIVYILISVRYIAGDWKKTFFGKEKKPAFIVNEKPPNPVKTKEENWQIDWWKNP